MITCVSPTAPPRHSSGQMSPNTGGAVERATRRLFSASAARPRADLGTVRGVAWLALIAVTFLGMSHPKIIQQDMEKMLLYLLLGAAIVAMVDFKNVRIPRLPALVVLFLVFCFMTALWSDLPDRVLGFSAIYVAIAVIAAFVTSNVTTRLLIRGLSLGGILVILLSFKAEWERHPLVVGLGPGETKLVLQGLYGNRNIMSYVLVLGLCCALADRAPNRIALVVKLGTVALYFHLLVRTSSATGLIVAIAVSFVALAVWLALRIPTVYLRRAGLTVGVFAVAGAVVVLTRLESYIALLGRDASFSGRVPLWNAILGEWLNRPIGGYGWGAVWSYAWYPVDSAEVRSRIVVEAGAPLNHGHNAVFDILIQVGIVGAAIYAFIIVQSFVRGTWGMRRGEPATRSEERRVGKECPV